jgi:single-strand DNA-binding protein
MPQLFGLARLGRDAELRGTNAGSVTNLSLAFEVRAKGEKITQWVEGALWGKRAETLAPHLVRGKQVVVTLGDVRIEQFTKGDGTTSHKLVGNVMELDFAGNTERTPERTPEQAVPRPAPPPPPPKASTGFADMDDVPF